MYDIKGKNKLLDFLLKEKLGIWSTSLSNELGRLSQGVRDIKGNNSLTCIHKQDVPHDKKVAYARMVCGYKPLNEENTGHDSL